MLQSISVDTEFMALKGRRFSGDLSKKEIFMKATLTLALFCLVGLSACSHNAAPALEGAAPEVAVCGCGKKASDCSCDKCKGKSAAKCECGKAKMAC